MSHKTKRKISWDDFTKDSHALARLIQAKDVPFGIVGVARGGLVPTAIITNALNIRNVKTVAIASYVGEEQRTAELLGSVDKIGTGEGWVFIDELADTGRSAALMKKRYPDAKFAAVYAKPEGMAQVDFFVKEMPQDEWLIFPWE